MSHHRLAKITAFETKLMTNPRHAPCTYCGDPKDRSYFARP